MAKQRFTKVDWRIVNAALAHHEAASYGEEEMAEEVPDGFTSWDAYYKRAQETREKVWDKLG